MIEADAGHWEEFLAKALVWGEQIQLALDLVQRDSLLGADKPHWLQVWVLHSYWLSSSPNGTMLGKQHTSLDLSSFIYIIMMVT
jgi:hypothetical protein